MGIGLNYHFPDGNALVTALLADQGFASLGVNLNIAGEDEMYLLDLQHHKNDRDAALVVYFGAGVRIARMLRQVLIWRFGRMDAIPSLLEFACGYGRSTCFLAAEVPPEAIWASDIHSEAARFQREQFGVNGFVSASRPDDFRCDRRFDCIVVGSPFSHLPQATFVPWLTKLYRLLEAGGILIFSVHDEVLLPSGRALPPAGIDFVASSEGRTLDTGEYGASWVNESFVGEAIVQASGGQKAAYRRIKWGIFGRQDVCVVSQDAAHDVSSLCGDGSSAPCGLELLLPDPRRRHPFSGPAHNQGRHKHWHGRRAALGQATCGVDRLAQHGRRFADIELIGQLTASGSRVSGEAAQIWQAPTPKKGGIP